MVQDKEYGAIQAPDQVLGSDLGCANSSAEQTTARREDAPATSTHTLKSGRIAQAGCLDPQKGGTSGKAQRAGR